MGIIKRQKTGTETLVLNDCPCCGGDIIAGDCGYSSFNPGWAACQGECKREWSLGYVLDAWSAGQAWNQKARTIVYQLKAASLLKVRKKLSISRDFHGEGLEEEAQELLKKLNELIIDAKSEPEQNTDYQPPPSIDLIHDKPKQ